MTESIAPGLRFGTPGGRWVLAATVLASGVAFLDTTVVNVALPAVSEELDTGVAGLQWILDGYLVTLTALLLLGGSLGDHYGRKRMLLVGLAGFGGASLLCGVAPNTATLIVARALQGAAGALLVPGSLAVISSSFASDDRSRAVGAWSGLAGASTAIGPPVAGWLVDAVSWRMVFFINIPLIVAAFWITVRHVPETRAHDPGGLDYPGASAITLGLLGVTYALIEGPVEGGPVPVVAGVLGVIAVIAFLLVERNSGHPMLPLDLFSSRQFAGANLTTLAVYGGLGVAFFLVVVQLQITAGWSALAAGVALLPFTLIMLLFSSQAGALAQRIGPRAPMTLGPLVAGVGLALLGEIGADADYLTDVLPGVAVFGAGMTLTVAPLTSAVLASVSEDHVGVASGTNNAIARLAGLLAIALVPALAGIDATASEGTALADGYGLAMRISAGLCMVGGLLAWVTIRSGAEVPPTIQASPAQPCHDPCRVEISGEAA